MCVLPMPAAHFDPSQCDRPRTEEDIGARNAACQCFERRRAPCCRVAYHERSKGRPSKRCNCWQGLVFRSLYRATGTTVTTGTAHCAALLRLSSARRRQRAGRADG